MNNLQQCQPKDHLQKGIAALLVHWYHGKNILVYFSYKTYLGRILSIYRVATPTWFYNIGAMIISCI